MPISKENRKLYPKDWKQISHRIRFERAGGRCEFEEKGLRCPALHGMLHPVTGSMVVLTTAHIDHDITNNDDENLAAWCQVHHNRHDVAHRVATRAATRRRKRGNGEMFQGARV